MLDVGGRERWYLSVVDRNKVAEFSKRWHLNTVLGRLLMSRNIGEGEEEKISSFINPPKDLILSFEGVTGEEDLKKALDRIEQAIRKKEKVVVNGDPDADGITACSIVVSSLRFLGVDVGYDFPTRCREGHGLQPRIIDQAKADGVSLIITTDCGSKDLKAADYAVDQGVDVIICDHHILGKTIPNCVSLVNPYRVEGYSPYKYLSGAGVAYKLMLAVFDRMKRSMSKVFRDYLLALVTLGTISDRMSFLEPMNRALILKGMQGIINTQMEGLKALRDISCPDVTSLLPREVSRTIVPRLNAPGRIGDREAGIPDSRIVVDLLLLGSGEANAEIASELVETFADVYETAQDLKKSAHGLREAAMVDDVNEQRKYITSRIEDEIEEYLLKNVKSLSEERVVVVRGKDWNPGVIGIDTDRLRERFLRPAVIITEYSGESYVRGSCRSIPKINMYKILDAVGEIFQEKYGRLLYQTEVQTDSGPRLINAFGGHAQACGFAMHEDDVATFTDLLKAQMETVDESDFDFSYEILDILQFEQLTPKFLDILDRLSPFGQQFEYPIYYLKRVDIGKIRAFGNRYQKNRTPHMDFMVFKRTKNKSSNGMGIPAVGFGLLDKFNQLKANAEDKATYDIIFMVERNVKRGKHNKRYPIRLNVMDIRFHGGSDNIDGFLDHDEFVWEDEG